MHTSLTIDKGEALLCLEFDWLDVVFLQHLSRGVVLIRSSIPTITHMWIDIHASTISCVNSDGCSLCCSSKDGAFLHSRITHRKRDGGTHTYVIITHRHICIFIFTHAYPYSHMHRASLPHLPLPQHTQGEVRERSQVSRCAHSPCHEQREISAGSQGSIGGGGWVVSDMHSNT